MRMSATPYAEMKAGDAAERSTAHRAVALEYRRGVRAASAAIHPPKQAASYQLAARECEKNCLAAAVVVVLLAMRAQCDSCASGE